MTPYGKVEPDYCSRKHFPAGTPITPADGSTKSIEDITTPGHRFMTKTGDYMEVGHMLRLGGGTMRLVEQDGTVIAATGEWVVYNDTTAHLHRSTVNGLAV